MQNQFSKFWKGISSDEKFDKSKKMAKDLQAGDILASRRDIVVSVSEQQGHIFVKGRNYNYSYEPNDMVELFDTKKE